MKRILTIIICMICVWMVTRATVPPRIRKTGAAASVPTYRAPWNTPSRRLGSQLDAPLYSIGLQRVPVVLVDFADLPFSVAKDKDTVHQFYDLYCNGTRDGVLYRGAGSYGAVRDYFVLQSDSLFLPEFEIVGPVTLERSYAYYGKNTASGKDRNRDAFVTDAVTKAQLLTDWNTFDNDGDGVVDMIYFIYAGEGENGSDDENTIWPHEQTSQRTIAGVKFGAYACCNEVYEGVADGIGVMCHELMHALGMPDLYDSSEKAYGMDYWDIMDTGCYCQSSYHPCGLSAYERDFMGWRKLVLLQRDEVANLTLLPISKGGVGYKMLSAENQHEYYIVENRQNIGWDKYIGRGTDEHQRHGLMISHVDYSIGRWSYNNVNTTADHQCFTIIPADGESYSFAHTETQEEYNHWERSAAADLFPGSLGVTYLFSRDQPLYTSSGSMHQPITGIVEHPDGIVTLTVCLFADVNGDGLADSQDVLKVYEYMQKQTSVEPLIPQDVNGDGVVDTQDVLQIYNNF